jgi:hypothetical protein
MTTARSSRKNSAALAACALVVITAAASAHRRDEYLQAARVAIDPDRVALALDLTPGIAVADQVIAEIDRDGDASITPEESSAYVQRVLSALTLDVDGRPLRLEIVERAIPAIDAMRQGEGAIRLQLAAALPALGAGVHRLRYRNAHRPDISVYLTNALVPASDRIAVDAQRRDAAQRDVTIEYALGADRAARVRAGVQVAGAGGAILVALVCWRRFGASGPEGRKVGRPEGRKAGRPEGRRIKRGS